MTDKKAEPAAAVAEVSKEEPEVGQMKRGDYLIHVFVESARQLKCSDGNTTDPLIEVTVMKDKKYTTAKDDIGSTGLCTWNEHLFFEPKNVSVEEIEKAQIQIKVLDKGYFKDAMIGCYDFDVAYVYFMKDHSLMHKWVALSNPQSPAFNEVTGYLKISISIAATGDKQIQISEDSGADKSDEAVLMPPSIRPEFYQIKFRFFRAEQLPAMDKALIGSGGSIDAYLLCNYMNHKLQTDVITAKEGVAINWNTEFWIPCQLPIMSSRVVMKLFDKDPITDEIVGSLLFNLKECINEKNGKFFWKNVYGSPLGCSGANTDLMNANPEVGSTWKGRLLMQVVAEKTEKPTCIRKPIAPEDIERAQEFLALREFEVIAEVGQAIALPGVDKYQIMIKIGEHSMKTDKPVFAENTYNRWNTRFKQTTFKAPYTDVYDIGRVYVYLMSGDKAISYFKADIEEFLNPNPEWRWFELNPDLAIGKVKEHYRAGIVSVKLSIHDKTKDGPINFEQFDAWKKPPAKRLNVQKVRAYIFQCRDLPAADSDGSSDPFIKLWDTTKDLKRTAIIEDNNNPLFYETVELLIETASVKDMPPFVLDVFDKDTLGEDFISRCLIPMKDARYSENDEIPEPKWHQCRIKAGAPAQGEVLVSFSIVESDYSFKIPMTHLRLQDQVDSQEYNIDINILGLRDLQSVGILPVKKAFIVFNLKSLVAPDDGRALENIRTQPNSPGPNPTINTLIKFRLSLPKAPLFCPRLSCTVHDYIFKGFSQPMIGTFTIPIGDLMHKLDQERITETAAIQNILNELEKIMKDEGVVSYSINDQSTALDGGFGDVSTNRSIEKVKSKIKVDDDMRKPLLDNDDLEEEKSHKSGISPRVTPRSMTMSQSGHAKKAQSNPMKMAQFDKFNSGMKGQLLQENKENEEKAKRELEDERQRQLEEMKRNGGSSAVKNIIMPQYTLDKRLNVYREYDSPPDSIFIGLGWDENPETKRRHYRRFYNQELENVKEIMPVSTPFESFEIKRGQSRGASKSWFSFGAQKQDESGEVSDEQVVGKFKGVVTVQSEEDKKAYMEKKMDLIHNLKVKLNSLSLKKTSRPLEFNMDKLDSMEGRQKMELELEKLGISHLRITKHLADLESDVILNRLLCAQTKCIVRVYIVDAFNLSSRDNGSDSDPYLVVSCGGFTYNERANYQEDEPNPKFYKHFDFEATFPGCSPLTINIMDYDEIFGDDSIGVTSVDLEDRFFSPEWQSVKQKPIEYRSLYHPSTSISQGTCRMWVEIHPTAIPVNEIPIWNMVPKPPEDFEVRLVIYDTVGVVAMDAEGTSDVYCRAFFDSRVDSKETDTHYRCTNGKASFNYRLLFNVQHPRKDYNLSIQLYDRDFFKSNDIIGDCSLDLKCAFEDAALSGRPLGLNKAYFNAYLKAKGVKMDYKDENSFWLPIMSKDDKGLIKENGKIRVQIDIFPKVMAEKNKVGEARQEPNHSPFLPPPVGRLELSLNPLKMFSQMIGPELKRKIYGYCCLAICLALCISLAPLIIGNIFSAFIESLIGLR